MASLRKRTPRQTETSKKAERVGIREFRQNIAKYVLESDAPVILTRHGDEVGYFVPMPRKPKLTAADLRAWDEHAERVDKMPAEKGFDGDRIVEEYERERKARRRP